MTKGAITPERTLGQVFCARGTMSPDAPLAGPYALPLAELVDGCVASFLDGLARECVAPDGEVGMTVLPVNGDPETAPDWCWPVCPNIVGPHVHVGVKARVRESDA